MLTRKALFLGFTSLFLAGLALGGEAIPNWSAPATWSPAKPRGGLTTMGDVTNPLPFIGLAPCRIADTRNPAGPYGAPALTGGVPRNFTLTGVCGIPSSAAAASLNVTVTNTQGPGFILIYPKGGSQPTVSTLNYVAGQTIANAAVVPLGTGGGITVIAGVSGTDLIIDVNGYYYGGTLGALASGESFTLVGDVIGESTGLLSVHNTEGAAGARAGYFLADSSGFGSTGIAGVESAGSGLTAGVYGQANSSAGDTAGVSGVATSTTGPVYGVRGQTYSTVGAGVYGVDSSGNPGVLGAQAGVLGVSTSAFGVIGFSKNTGVYGAMLNSAGGVQSGGALGNGTAGVYFMNGLAGSGVKSFVEPHPTDASKVIRYVSLEGPESGTYFRGRGKFQRGLATIEPPEDFRMVTDPESLSIQVTPIGDLATVAVMRIGIDGIVVKGSRDVEFFYLINGVRRAYNHWNPVQENEEFFVPESPAAKLPLYLSEDERGRLIANGTYNPDGTVNMETAERLGWVTAWRDREEQAKAAAAANAAARATRFPGKN